MEEAEHHYQAHLKNDPDSHIAWHGLAKIHLLNKNPEKAAEYLWRAVMASKNNIELVNDLIDLLIKLADFDRAIVVCQSAIARKPEDVRAYLALSALLIEKNQPARARQVLEGGIGRKPLFSQPCLRRPAAKILKMRGIQNAFYTLGISRNGRPNLKLRGGNYSSRYLWNSSRFTTHNLWVLNNNIMDLPGIPEHDVLVNTIADPDIERQSLETLSRYIDQRNDRPVINHPDHVLLTTRDSNYRRINRLDGFVFGKTMRVQLDQNDEFDGALFFKKENYELPVILRRTGTHTGRTVIKADTMEQAEAFFREQAGEEIYVIQYVENLFREKYHRKMRLFFIDGQPYPVVHHIDDHWNVHGSNRRTLMEPNGWMTEIEKSYLNDPRGYLGADIFERLQSLPALVQLDFFGVDFTVTDDGRILVFELNPAMRHSFDHADNFEYLRPYTQNVTDAFQKMITDRASLP